MGSRAKTIPKHALVAERRRQMRRRGSLAELESLFGPPPLLDGEDEIAYLDLADRVRSAVDPQDAIDEIFARETADLYWEILRYRRASISLQRAAFRKAALRLVYRVDPQAARRLEDTSDSAFETSLRRTFKEFGLSLDQAHAEALAQTLPEVERIDALMRKTQARWLALRRESDRRRETLLRLDAILTARLIEPAKITEQEDENPEPPA